MPQPKMFTDEELRARKNARTAQRYREKRDEISAYHKALNAEKSKDPAYRAAQSERAARYRAANPEQTKRQNAKRRAADPDLARRESREWFARNPERRAAYEQNRRAKKRARAGKLSANIIETLMAKQRGLCACCRVDLKLSGVHLDHVMPLALGGEHADKNMQLLCPPCNQQKHSKHPIDFMQQKGFLL